VLFVALVYYCQVSFAIPALLYRKRYLAFAIFLPATIALAALLRSFLFVWLQRRVFHIVPPAFPVIFRDSCLNILFWALCLLAARLVYERIRLRRYIDEMEKEKTRNELDFLKAQFNPHFLFNSINSIYGHIDRRNGRARDMLLNFSEMLRYQLYECNVDNIVIEKEVTYIRNYIALQQERKEESLVVAVDIPGNVNGFTIAPLMLISFVENAFKYVSTYEDRENRVEVSMRRKAAEFEFRCFNTKDRRTLGATDGAAIFGRTGSAVGTEAIYEMEKGGIGITNARRRLELQYPNTHTLDITDGGDYFEVVMKLNIETHAVKNGYRRRRAGRA
jgi:LytS/YehU family sensor histidine kinase